MSINRNEKDSFPFPPIKNRTHREYEISVKSKSDVYAVLRGCILCLLVHLPGATFNLIARIGGLRMRFGYSVFLTLHVD